MAEIETEASYRSLQDRYRALDNRARRYTGVVFTLMGWSAVSNFLGALTAIANAATASLLDTSISVAVSLVLGTLYALGALRVWLKDDTRWWPVALPACITLVVSALLVSAGHPAFWPFIINIVLLLLVPFRREAEAAAVAHQPPSVADAFAPPAHTPPMSAEQNRPCPFCAEQILSAAIKCKHCGSDLRV